MAAKRYGGRSGDGGSRGIAVTVGTRPEIIKMAPIIRELQAQGERFYIIHSGQHYSYDLDRIFFDQLGLPEPRYRLDVGPAAVSAAQQTARIIEGAARVLGRTRPGVVLVQGDTNTVLGTAIAARKTGIPIGHVEAGLRSYDGSMPEEWNRILADHCSDYLFAPTANSKRILLGEKIGREKIFVTGNTIVDSVMHNIRLSGYSERGRLMVMPEKGGKAGRRRQQQQQFALVSLHRQENVDSQRRFGDIVRGLRMVGKRLGIPVIYPIHPRSKKMARRLGIPLDGLRVVRPVDYLTFLQLEKDARLILTDSGGVQEEACILGTPCVTLRDNTERPETVEVGANMVAGTCPERILECARVMVDRHGDGGDGSNNNNNNNNSSSSAGAGMNVSAPWKNPFGRGDSAKRIVGILRDGMAG